MHTGHKTTEFLLELSANDLNGDFRIMAKYLDPNSDVEQKARSIAKKYNLSDLSQSGIIELSGNVQAKNLTSVLTAFLEP